MADFGIGEAIAATSAAEAGAKGAETAGAALGGDLLAPAGEAALGFAPEAVGAAAPAGIDLGGVFGELGGVAGEAGGGAGAVPGAGSVDLASTVSSGGFPTAAAPSGPGAATFAPAPGVQLPSGIAADATSAAAFDTTNPLTFAERAAPAVEAGRNGTFAGFELPQSPVGSGAGAADFSVPPGGTPTASPSLGDFTTPTGATSGGTAPTAAGGVTSSVGAPLDITTNPVPAAASPGSTNILGKVGQGAVDSITKNPLGIGLGAAGLGLNLANANKQSQAVKNVQAQAGKQSQTADQLANYALTGTVPAGSQAGIDKAIAEAKANAISNAAGQGLPTDPTKNTALAATLAKIDAQGPILAAQIGQQLLQSGATYAGLSDQLYTQLASIDQSQRASMGKAIANFAAALNTGGGTKIQIGGTSA